MTIEKYDTGNCLTVGSTRSGKSFAEINKVVAAAGARDVAIVVIDPHQKSLAWNAFQQLSARRYGRRIVYDDLSSLDRVPGYRFLRPSRASNALRRGALNDQAAQEFKDVLIRRRQTQGLESSPLTEEHTLSALKLLLNQPREYPASHLRYAFNVGHHIFNRLVEDCTDPDTQFVFREIADGNIRRSQFASAQRLINGVCASPPFIARCGTQFNLPRFLDDCGILIVEGGGEGVSHEASSAIMGAIILQVIAYVRSRNRSQPRVLLVLDEATNHQLIGGSGFEVRAMAECQKMGLDFHVLVQLLDFPSTRITEGVLTNCIRHDWFYLANAGVARRAAEDLGLGTEGASSLRSLKIGERYVKVRGHVSREQVQPLANPWVFPRLADRKARKVLEEIRQRPVYRTPMPESSEAAVDSFETAPAQRSSETCEPTPHAVATPCPTADSPAKRLRELRDGKWPAAVPAVTEDLSANWRKRDALIVRLLQTHPCSTRHFFRYFSSEKAAYRRLRTLNDRGEVKEVGNVSLNDDGRPETVFCNGWRPNALRHEVLLTDFLLALGEPDVLRGHKVNKRVRADAELTLDGIRFFVELDTGEETHSQVRKRQAVYRGVSDFVLYVTLSDRRMKGLVEGAADAVRNIALFTTLDRAVEHPRGVVWVDCFGERTGV